MIFSEIGGCSLTFWAFWPFFILFRFVYCLYLFVPSIYSPCEYNIISNRPTYCWEGYMREQGYVVSSVRSRSNICCSNGENIVSNSAAVLGVVVFGIVG